MKLRGFRTPWAALALMALAVFLLAGCQAAPAGTGTGPVDGAGAPVDSGYPAPGGGQATAPTVAPDLDAYPVDAGGGQPMAAPAAPNASLVTARLLDQSPAEAEGFVQLHVLVLASETIAGMPSFTSDLLDQEIYLIVEAAALPVLAEGDSFTAEVEFRGDEFGGQYFARNPQKISP
jgi:hypothetical protein